MKKGILCTLLMLMMACALVFTFGQAEARITRIEDVAISNAPAFDSRFEQIDGIAYGEIDPSDPRNAIIQDIALAPKNERGNVEYNTDFRIWRPKVGGSGILLYDVVNRGGPISEYVFGPWWVLGNDITRERGYITVWSGWQGDLLEATGRFNIRVPVATDEEGEIITGTVRTEYIVDAPTSTLRLSSGGFTGSNLPTSNHRSYEPFSLDTSQATLTRRVLESDPREAISAGDWAYADCTGTTAFQGTLDPQLICLKDDFDPNDIYELVYEAKDPLVLGIGYAATRDLIAFLNHAETDDEGTPNPIASMVEKTLIHGTSQSGRYIRSFIDLGFNEDETGRIVFDGANPHIATGRIPLNVRFGQPGRAYGQHVDHLFPAFESLFTWNPMHDPIADRYYGSDSDKKDKKKQKKKKKKKKKKKEAEGLLDRCRRSKTCPKIFSTVSSTEYWQGRASLNSTDALGRHDVGLPGNVRMYLFSGTQHFAFPGSAPTSSVTCQQLSNPNSYMPHMRALLVALEEWVVDNVKPPKSRIPTIRKRTLASSDQESIGFPDIPGVTYTGLLNELTLLDQGPEFDTRNESGIIDEPTMVVDGLDYTVLLPKVDADGNEIAGIRSPDIQAPIGTYAGWNLRREGFAEGELCGLTGTFVPFAETKGGRLAIRDPRLSLEERYDDHEGYVEAVIDAAEQLVAERLLLPGDADWFIQRAEDSDILNP
jgi:hypothetical protein